MKRIFALAAICLAHAALSQTSFQDIDAMRYSQNTLGGTARSMGMGGAFGALGADFSCLSINPAGIGLYTKSELTFTPSVIVSNTSSTLKDQLTKDSKASFNFTNAGLVLTYRNRDKDSPWLNTNFGFGYNRQSDFNTRTSYTDKSSSGSIIDNYLDRLVRGGIQPSDLDPSHVSIDLIEPALAFQTYLIDTARGAYNSDSPSDGRVLSRKVTQYGSVGDLAISFGANYKDLLYLGASLGIMSLSYEQASTYTEVNNGSRDSIFRSMELKQDFATSGSGFNFKIGAILRPIDWFRVGLTYHTSTYYTLEDNNTYEMTGNFKVPFGPQGLSTYKANTTSLVSYNLSTPSKVIASLGFVILKKGIISGDLEMIDYSTANFSANSTNYNDVNNYISQNYKAKFNYHLGAEYRIDNTFSVRAGYAYYASPFDDATRPISSVALPDLSRKNYTLGLGIRGAGYFLDFAYILQKTRDAILLSNEYSGIANGYSSISTGRVAVTVGLRF